jgi:hypothetical protein
MSITVRAMTRDDEHEVIVPEYCSVFVLYFVVCLSVCTYTVMLFHQICASMYYYTSTLTYE